MFNVVLAALWAWGVMNPIPGAAAETSFPSAAQEQAALDAELNSHTFLEQLIKRQSNAPPSSGDTICKAFGVDYQDGGSYFIDQRSLEPFQAVTKFEGCQKSDADVLLVDRQTSQQYGCGKIPTRPDEKPQMATCEIMESEMRSGNWSLIILGDNALKGKPFAYQRDFTLNVAPQKTITLSKTCIYTYTEKPTRTMTSIYTSATTSTLPNSLTLTKPAATNVITITPRPSTIFATSTITRTFTTWTRTEEKDTAFVTPSCTVPPKAMLADGMCKIVPTIKPVPQGIDIGKPEEKRADREADVQEMRKRFENADAASSRLASASASVSAPPSPPPAGVPATVTVTAKYPVNSTTTLTLPAKTMQVLSTKTNTLFVTAPPKTVFLGTAMQTSYAPAKTVTEVRKAWTRVYEVQTMSVQWTWTGTKEAAPEETGVCRARGGRMVV